MPGPEISAKTGHTAMKLPADAEVYELPNCSFWFDPKGFLCCLCKNTASNLKETQETFAFLRTLLKDRKVCLLMDATMKLPLDRETSDYMDREIHHYFDAVAITSDSVLGRIVVKVFLHLKPQRIPIKMFTTEQEGREWLVQYMPSHTN